MGKRVLLIDLDPQANLSQSLGVPEEVEPTIYDAIKQESFGEEASLESVIMPTNGMSLIPASLELSMAEMELVSIYGREQILPNCFGD